MPVLFLVQINFQLSNFHYRMDLRVNRTLRVLPKDQCVLQVKKLAVARHMLLWNASAQTRMESS